MGHPKPCHRCLGERFCTKTKKSQKTLRLDFERKTGHPKYIYTPNPLTGGILGSLVKTLVFCSKQSLPYQREVWRVCLYGRGLFRETHKKRIAICYPSCVERKTRVCPSAPHSVYQAITFAQYYTPNSRDTWVVSRCRFRVRLLPYKLQNYSCLRQIYE